MLNIIFAGWSNTEASARSAIKQGAKDAGRIEARQTEPINGTVQRDQGSRPQIPDNSMAGDPRVMLRSLIRRCGLYFLGLDGLASVHSANSREMPARLI